MRRLYVGYSGGAAGDSDDGSECGASGNEEDRSVPGGNDGSGGDDEGVTEVVVGGCEGLRCEETETTVPLMYVSENYSTQIWDLAG